MPIPGFGEGFFSTTRNTIVSGFLALPVILITISAFLGTATANVGFILLFLGQIFIIPLIQYLTGVLRNMSSIQKILGLGSTLTYGSFNKLCAISPVDVKPDMTVPPVSYWMANVIFFATYVLTNGVSLLNADVETKNADATKVENRKAQAITSLLLTAGIFVFLIYQHYRYVGCETPGSAFLALLLYVPLGFGWYKLAELCGIRTADTFGIASQLFLPDGDNTMYPYACVNLATKTQFYKFKEFGTLTPDAFVKKLIPETTNKDFAEITYGRDEKGVFTMTLTLNKKDEKLPLEGSIVMMGLANLFKKNFDTVIDSKLGQNGIQFKAQPPAAYSV